MSIRARYDELTGNLAGAVVEMRQAAQIVDRIVEIPAYTRSWYHFADRAVRVRRRSDASIALAEFDEALRIFPG